MNADKKRIPQVGCPRGFAGKLVFIFMNRGHKSIYENAKKVLQLRPEDDLLDVACGNGYFLKNYASNVRSVAGLDLSELSVKLATKKNKKRVAAGKAEFVQGDAAALPWEDNTFSAVTSMGSFISFPKPLESLRQMHRVLRPGGRVVIVFDWNAEDGMDHAKYVEKYGMTMYTENEARTLMKEAGFFDISVSYAKGFMMPKIMIARATK